ncbi:hypothetical protein N431DRAFT_429525 [Stipitochalara longipes BDJ]|nr:hypothetical protein N431DRAFT_429525 [Stipitochalara longipes BDJ]
MTQVIVGALATPLRSAVTWAFGGVWRSSWRLRVAFLIGERAGAGSGGWAWGPMVVLGGLFQAFEMERGEVVRGGWWLVG